MAKRPRKSPDPFRTPSSKKPRRIHPAVALSGAALGLAGQGMGATARMVGRYPTLMLGGAAFAVAMSFISANALWYQHGNHPAPIFRTRDAHDQTAFAGAPSNAAEARPADVTTFRIERADGTTETPDPAATAAVPAAPARKPSALMRDVQGALIGHGFYDGPADGYGGPRTTAAILAFEKSAGLHQTGQASADLLAALLTVKSSAGAVPGERPNDVASDAGTQIDPVAAAILKADKQLPVSPAAPKPDLVMKIQRGLTNLAYADIKVDGVAGDVTRKAIRHFQKHYRLAETGEPSETVLKKMKEIGAL